MKKSDNCLIDSYGIFYYFCSMKKIGVFIFSLLVVFISSCSEKRELVLEHNFSGSEWIFSEPVTFDTIINDKENPYRVTFQIVFNNDYPFDHFTYVYSQKNDDGEKLTVNKNIIIRNKSGELLFDTKEGKIYCEQLINGSTYFNSLNNYTFKIENAMSKYKLEGIESVSLDIRRK